MNHLRIKSGSVRVQFVAFTLKEANNMRKIKLLSDAVGSHRLVPDVNQRTILVP